MIFDQLSIQRSNKEANVTHLLSYLAYKHTYELHGVTEPFAKVFTWHWSQQIVTYDSIRKELDPHPGYQSLDLGLDFQMELNDKKIVFPVL